MLWSYSEQKIFALHDIEDQSILGETSASFLNPFQIDTRELLCLEAIPVHAFQWIVLLLVVELGLLCD